MPRFEYKAKDGPEKVVEGVVAAPSRADALAILEGRGLIPVWVRAAGESTEHDSIGRGISVREITILTRQMSGLIRAGVPILRTLATLQEQCENGRLAAVLARVEADIREGGMLSSALARHERLFPPLYVSMVRAGESAGKLDTVLERLATAREAEDEARRRVRSAVAYPALILIVGMVTVFVLLTFFMPRVAGLFTSFADLPMPTRILLMVSGFLSRHWPWLVVLVVLGIVGMRRVARMTAGRLEMDRLKMRLPGIGRVWLESDVARFARTFAMLLDAGVPLSATLDLSASTLENAALRADVLRVKREAVQEGQPISTGLKRSKVFPSLLASLAAVGEESGRLAEALEEAAGYYEKDVEHRVRTALSLLEPVLILAVGAVVGFIVAAMLLPIFRLSLAL